jgi:hypothetical protein
MNKTAVKRYWMEAEGPMGERVDSDESSVQVVLASDYDALQAARDALMADAKRYRFLCNRAEKYTTEHDCVFFSWKVGPRTIYIPPSKQDVDAAIDAVME